MTEKILEFPSSHKQEKKPKTGKFLGREPADILEAKRRLEFKKTIKEKAKTHEERMDFLRARYYNELHSMARTGQISPEEIEQLGKYDSQFTEALTEMAGTHQVLKEAGQRRESLNEEIRILQQENQQLRKKLEESQTAL